MLLKPLTKTNIPKLVLIQIINNCVINHINVQLTSDQLTNIYNLTKDPLPKGINSKLITINKEYDIERFGNCELRLKLRQINKNIINSIDNINYINAQYLIDSKIMIHMEHKKEFEFQIIFPKNNNTTYNNDDDYSNQLQEISDRIFY